jgi:choline-glycine betaine transporter
MLTGYRLLLDDWRGLLIALFALVWVANVYMSIFGRLRLGIKAERTEIELKEEVLANRG